MPSYSTRAMINAVAAIVQPAAEVVQHVRRSAATAAWVEHEVASGDYGTASEVVRDALRRERAAQDAKLMIFRREVGGGANMEASQNNMESTEKAHGERRRALIDRIAR
jgi:putative addiction module CopG family antidote